MTTGPVTKSGDSLLGFAVREGNVDVINYLVTEHTVDINGEWDKYKALYNNIDLMHGACTIDVFSG